MTVVINGTTGITNPNNMTVGNGGGNVATNTAVGTSALAANSTGSGVTAIGTEALASSTASNNTAVGYQAAYVNTAADNTAIGVKAMLTNTTGTLNVATGGSALRLNTTGSSNTALGVSALFSNTTASNNTAVGYQAGYANTTGTITAFGYQAGYACTTATATSAFGNSALVANTTGDQNSAFGSAALVNNTTGSYNVALGRSALLNNTTASNNTAVGYQALYSYQTGGDNVAVGTQAGYSINGNGNATFLGRSAGYSTTGGNNTFVGYQAGYYVSTGAKNTIVGLYNGNYGGLDIRTASNYIVLSDGDGNPAAYRASAGQWRFGLGGTGSSNEGGFELNGSSATGNGPIVIGYRNGTTSWYAGAYAYLLGGTTNNYIVRAGTSGGVYVADGATSWTAVSDERLKDIIEPINDAVNKVSTLRAVIGKYKTDAEGTRRSFLIAQDVQAVLPEAVTAAINSKDDDTEYFGVAYTEVIPLLVAAIKELKAEFDAYKEAHP